MKTTGITKPAGGMGKKRNLKWAQNEGKDEMTFDTTEREELENKEIYDGNSDARLSWVEATLASYFRNVKSDKFKKFIGTSSVINQIVSFLDSSGQETIYFAETSGNLSILNAAPSVKDNRTTLLYFSKSKSSRVCSERFASEVIVGDCKLEPVNHLENVVQSVYMPLMSIPANQESWSDAVRKEVIDNVYGFVSDIQITTGLMRGETFLPIPLLEWNSSASENKTSSIADKDKIHAFESCIITWTKQIREILRSDPEAKLKDGQHPGPMEEILFWEVKASKLNSIFEQLEGPKVRKVIQILDSSKSTYNQPFAKLCKEVLQAREEANDNVKCLSPLRDWLKKLETEPAFENLAYVFRPMMHIILNIWKHSKFYNTMPRLVILMKEICNQIIHRSIKFLDGSKIFQLIEADDTSSALKMLRSMLKLIGNFKSTYFDYKAKANAECLSNPWKIQNNALFSRLDSFLQRCHDLLELTQTIKEFSKLDQIEVGGTKGKTLTTSVHQIHGDFENALSIFKVVSYDILDVDVKQFDDDFYEFRTNIKELERRLASVLTQGFDDCATIVGRFKLLDCFEDLLNRGIIKDELENKHLILLNSYAEDLSLVQLEFSTLKDSPPISNNLPPIAGAMTWCRGLLDRVRLPMESLRRINSNILDRDGAKEVIKRYTSLVAVLANFENDIAKSWEESIETSSLSKLKLPLLKSEANSFLKVNFDEALVCLLREVKYLLLLGVSIPESALSLYISAEQIRQQTGNLDLIVKIYNRIEATLLPVERPLINKYMNKTNKVLQHGMKTLTWKSHGIEAFIGESSTAVEEADKILGIMKGTMHKIEERLDSWAISPMMARRAKPISIEEFNSEFRGVCNQKYQVITEGGKQIHKIIKDVVKALKISAGLPDWKAYVDFLNCIVIDGLVRTVDTSLEFLNEQIDPNNIKQNNLSPVLEIELILTSRMVLFSPPLEETSKNNGVRDEIRNWIDQFLKVGALFKRLDSPNGTYIKELLYDPRVQLSFSKIYEHLEFTIELANELRKEYCEYEYLWTTDIAEMFEDFLETAYLPNWPENEDFELEGKEEGEDENSEEDDDDEKSNVLSDDHSQDSVEKRALNLAMFDERINHYERVRIAISELASSVNVGFLRISTQPIKQALSTWVTKWIYVFTQHLHDFVYSRLKNLSDFMQEVEIGLTVDVKSPDFDKNKLMDVMRHIRKVRRSMKETKMMFGPLRSICNLLRSHGIYFEGEMINEMSVLDFLKEAPELWDTTIDNTFKAKEIIQPLQNQMADTVIQNVRTFELRVAGFRNDFIKNGPFNIGGLESNDPAHPDTAYEILGKYNLQLDTLMSESKTLAELEDLFDLRATKMDVIFETETELHQLKLIWDLVAVADYTISSWRPLLWKEINTEELENETMLLVKMIKDLIPKGKRTWEVCRQVERKVSNMAIVIPLVHELRSPALRDRHWKKLFAVTDKSFEKTSQFCLDDVLKLELYNYASEVEEIVEVAKREMKIDQKLKCIEDSWIRFNFEYIQHKDTEYHVLLPSPEIIEALEEHQLALQTMSGMGKFVEFFKERVYTWQRTLGNVESTLTLWLNVQRYWVSLESIFLTSADIRAQLPEDTKKFEGIDQSFKDIMKEAQDMSNVLQACTAEGREEVLQHMWRELEQCQKALNEYLDKKKDIFPRFYFVSNTALLDILSNGNDPRKIMKHFGACFDGMRCLEMIDDENEDIDPENEDDAPNKKDKRKKQEHFANAMVAKDGEVVKFETDFLITGAVEHWLNDVTDIMQTTLKKETSRALEGVSGWEFDLPREQWIMLAPAQVAILASQITWTEETAAAINEMEEGGQPEAMEKYYALCTSRLEALIRLVQGEIPAPERQKIITLITLDVHAREVIGSIMSKKVESASAFVWQSQLRYYWSDENKESNIEICDYKTTYANEYLGNTGRLVITPLTDRCYITLTMALKLKLGGAPAGPAGTGKTETTKDLARGLGLPCYVFNCSDQMNYQTMADIFKGLSQTGAWGCFDEFNRIPIEVLSVVATQVKTVLDAIRLLADPENRVDPYNQLPAGTPPCKVGMFKFTGGQPISLVPTVGFFITMNPGYAGRQELPENLKCHFRSCAMITPDLQPICENMLMAEGFVSARPLSIKFVTLYRLSSELLSPQVHYDWGLRNVKSVLRVAGTLKRAEPEIDEAPILMRALRDFNTPKMGASDLPIFNQLISDLFPGLSLSTEQDECLKKKVVSACKHEKLQSDALFVHKVVNFQEILEVRHSVMLLGSAGCGKTTIWKTLSRAHNIDCKKPVCVSEVVNPKAVTSDELYGFMTLQKDWKDGALSILMRNMSNNTGTFNESQNAKWVILDGDIDAVWIESMNTVMDDNKVLTLVSNERIPLTPSMRLVFEVHSLKNATPATVSRAGILYINDTDIGWSPFVESWINYSRTDESELATLPALFQQYIPTALGFIKSHGLQSIVPQVTIALIQHTCHILEGLLNNIPCEQRNKECIEHMFVFAAIWAIGGSLLCESNKDHQRKFSDAWRAEFKTVKFTDDDLTVFDYFYDPTKGKMIPWLDILEPYVPLGDNTATFANIFVPTTKSLRTTFLLDSLVKNNRPVCLVGGAGTGKTTIINKFLRNNQDTITQANINMNYYTDSMALQLQLEQYVDKKSGRIYGPPGSKCLVYFIDDLNMPFVEEYGTQTPIALLRQYMDYKCWYDRSDLGLKKEIQGVQFLSAMNQTAGSFNINQRLQRHFVVLAYSMPEEADLNQIYQSILQSNMDRFSEDMKALSNTIVRASLELYHSISEKFKPSAARFHYQFNMRDLGSLFCGLCMIDQSCQPLEFIRLFIHESRRIFRDRMINEKDESNLEAIILQVVKKNFEFNLEEILEKPILFTRFGHVSLDDDDEDLGPYLPIRSFKHIQTYLYDRLHEYNEIKPAMDLVLFNMASEHVARIARIISQPRGNALLVGLGGSGKQSLSRLATFICGFQLIQISVTSDYSIIDFKENLKELYRRAGVKPALPIVFLLTDTQIVDEKFLVYMNDVLSSGYIPDLFTSDDYEAIYSNLRAEAKQSGIPDTPIHLMEYFLSRVRSNLHIILCFSPVGSLFRARANKFPALVNCSVIDWFHRWPREALVNVAEHFLSETYLGNEDVSENVMHHVAEVHLSVTERSKAFFENFQRHNYVTPKTYLEFISFYKRSLGENTDKLAAEVDRLSMGLDKLRSTAKDVSEMQEELKETMERVKDRKERTEELLEQMGHQRGEAEAQQAIASKERVRAEKCAREAEEIEADAEVELAQAQPAMDQASEAINCLTKPSLTELKSLQKPPTGVDKVTTCVLMMVKNEKRNFSWDNAKRMMANVDQFKASLEEYDAKNIPEEVIQRLEPVLKDPDFTYEKLQKKSSAAANMANWVLNIISFNSIYKKVKPLMDRLEEARKNKENATDDLERVEGHLNDVKTRLNELQETFMQATKEKTAVELEAKECTARLGLAERLVNGLASENERWEHEVENLNEEKITLVGDTLLAAAFVSYIGAFDADTRSALWEQTWMVDITSREIPLSTGIVPLKMLAVDAEIAQWRVEGLPADPVSIDNAAICTTSTRWPLIIDPQLQGISWLRKRFENYENGFAVMQLTQDNWLHKLKGFIRSGSTVIIESIGEELDAVLEPLLSRCVYYKGRQPFLMLGADELEYDPNFKLFLQTKLSNPHYKPEIAAQCTIINFMVTEKGLENQLLAEVVTLERPELEEEKQQLQKQFNEFKIKMLELENTLLEKLANAPPDILSDVPLIEGLEQTKATAQEINIAVEQATKTEESINETREVYRPVATEASMLYFMMLQLCYVNHMYNYSLQSFLVFFQKALKGVEGDFESVESRTQALISSLRFTIYTMVSRGLFESHKLVALAQITFSLCLAGIISSTPQDKVTNEGLNFLLRAPRKFDSENEVEWLPDSTWQTACALSDQEGFESFAADLLESAPRFKEWYNHVTPELEVLPLDWRELEKQPFRKLLVVRTLRPDRTIGALTEFIKSSLPEGSKYLECDNQLNSYQVLESAFEDSDPNTPIYFILSAGSDVVGDVDRLSKKMDMVQGQNYFNISLGQGQDKVAMEKLEAGFREGWWIFLNNVHLMPKWLVTLQKQLDIFSVQTAHENFRVFLSSDPSPLIPVGILERSIKLTNEPPTGLKANLKRAFAQFSPDEVNLMDSKMRSILFGLCYFHSVMIERKSFGTVGFNMQYPFTKGDLSACSIVLSNYMEDAGTKPPWEDLRYLFGEIMYGGHIVNSLDRIVCNTYLEFFLCDKLLDEMELFPYVGENGPSFLAPSASTYEKYVEHINQTLPPETPLAFGLHSNAEIGFRTDQSISMFKTLQSMQQGQSDSNGEEQSAQHVAEAVMQDVIEGFSDIEFENLEDVIQSFVNLDDDEELSPFTNVILQECQRMQTLLSEMTRSLTELELGFRGDLTISEDMENLMNSLYLDQVPTAWRKWAYPSERPLGSWLNNLQARINHLQDWFVDPATTPTVTWISGLFNPSAFLTAITQTTARQTQMPLEDFVISTEVLKRLENEVKEPSRDGSFITGLSMEGARWDFAAVAIAESKPKEMLSSMPVINCKAILVKDAESVNIFRCPVYKTQRRADTYVFSASLRTKVPAQKWILAGVVLLLDAI